jgi:hypothetical protein
VPGGSNCPPMDSGFKPRLAWQSLVFGMSGEIDSVHRCCPGVEVGGIVHKPMFKRPLITGLTAKCPGRQVIPLGLDDWMQSDHGYSAAGTEFDVGGAICDRSQFIGFRQSRAHRDVSASAPHR